MDLGSARALKSQLTGGIAALSVAAPRAFAADGGTAPVAGVAYAAMRRTDVDPLARTVALGLSRKSRNDYVLAVRVQRRSLIDSPHVERIRRAARNEVDIRYIGRVAARVPFNQDRHRPLQIGLSIGHYLITAGTLGAFVKLRGNGEVRMLSNNHVFADENRGKQGDAILQQGPIDGGRDPQDRVGALAEFRRLTKSKHNFIDAALATVGKGIDFRSKLLKGHGQLRGTLLDQTQATGTVEKIGRTTGHTTGRITAFEINNIVIGYGKRTGNLRFDDQIEIEGSGTKSFSDGGDSGSIIFTTADHLAMALLFAGGETGGSNDAGLTYANPIGHVLDDLKIDLLL